MNLENLGCSRGLAEKLGGGFVGLASIAESLFSLAHLDLNVSFDLTHSRQSI